MPPLHAIQASFAGGELSPKVQARVDLQKYASGAKQLRNFIVAPQGSACKRPGLQYIATAKDSTHPVRVITFEAASNKVYRIELGHQYARFYKSGAQINTSGVSAWATSTHYVIGDLVTNGGATYYCLAAHTSGTFAADLAAGDWYAQTGTIYEIPTPWSGSDLWLLRFCQSADVMYIFHPTYAPRTLTYYTDTDWEIDLYPFVNGPWMLENEDTTQTLTLGAVSGTGVSLVSTLAQFVAGHVGSLWQIIHTIIGQSASDVLGAGGDSGTSLQCGGTWNLTTNGSWTGTIVLQMSTDNGVTWHALQSWTSANNANYQTSGQTGQAQCIIRVAAVGGGIGLDGVGAGGLVSWSGSATCNLNADSFDWNGVVQITAVADSTHATVNVLTIAGGTTATSQWSEGAWSTYRGWPSGGTFFQDRLWTWRTPSQPNTYWASKSSSYADYGVSDPVLDSDALNSNLPSQRLNAIQSMAPLRDLIALTTESDYALESSTGVITPTTLQAVPQGNRGAAAVDPVISGLALIIVQPMGTVVRDLRFSIYTNSYSGNNLSLNSNHLLLGYSIVSLAYAQEPDSVIWFVRSDGALLSLTYLPEQEMVCWTRHDTEGLFEFVCTGPSDDGTYNELWFVVNRDGTRFIERMSNPIASDEPEDQFYVDSGLTFDNPIAITAVSTAKAAVVTAPAHGFSNGDVVDIDGSIVGMDVWKDENGNVVPTPGTDDDVTKLTRGTLQANGYVVAAAMTDTFQLNDSLGNPVDSSGMNAYQSGGNCRKQVTSVSGLDHLNGQTVSVLANGFVQTQKVVANGSIALDAGASRVQAGLPYISDLETLNMEMPQQDGTVQGRKVKISEVTLRVEKTTGALIMQGEQTANFKPIRAPQTPLKASLAQPLFTGELPRIQLGGNYDYGARIWIRQSDPLPLTILSIMPNATVGA